MIAAALMLAALSAHAEELLHLRLDETTGPAHATPTARVSLGSRVMRGVPGVVGDGVEITGRGKSSDTPADSVVVQDLGDASYQELSVSLWYRLPPEAHDGYLFSWGGALGDANSISAWIDVGKELRVRIHDATDTTSVLRAAPSGFDNALWHHLAIVKDAIGSALYVDGQEVARSGDGDGSITPKTAFVIGGRPDSAFGLEAAVDELRIHGGARSASDLALEYASNKPSDDPMGTFGSYRTTVELEQALRHAAQRRPDLVEIIDFGDSFAKTAGGVTLPAGVQSSGTHIGGHDLLAARVARCPQDFANKPTGRPPLVLLAGLHAREIAPPEIALLLLDSLLKGYETDPDITFLLDHHDVWIIPVANPDGHDLVQLGNSEANGGRPWRWRKNLHLSGNCPWPPPSSGATFGVDLNRAFPFAWGSGSGNGGNTSRCSAYYRGGEPGMEPEVQAIMELLTAIFGDHRESAIQGAAPETTPGVFIQLHSPYGTVAWPWSHRTEPAPNAAGLEAVGRRLGALTGYATGQAHDAIYAMAGSLDDWVYGELGVASYLIEMGEGLMPAFGRVHNVLWPEMREALIYAAKVSRQPYLAGRGPVVDDVTLVATDDGVVLTARADGALPPDGDGGEGGQVASVEVFITRPIAGIEGQSLDAVDGIFDATVERATGLLSLEGLSSGPHLIYVRATNRAGFSGAPTAAWLEMP